MISISDLRRNDFRLRFETEIIPSLFRDGNRDRIISVSNQRRNLRRKSFSLYLETETPSLFRDGNRDRIFSVSNQRRKKSVFD